MNFRYLVIIGLILFITEQVNGQITLKDLNGEWTIDNKDSSYYKSDTIYLHQDINYVYGLKGTCDVVVWTKEKSKFKIEYKRICSEPGRVMSYDDKETIKLKKKNKKQIIEIRRNKKVIEVFEVCDNIEKRVDRYPYDIKILTLKRIE